MDSLHFTFHFSLFHKDGGRRSIAGIKERFERNPLQKRDPNEKMYLQFYMRNPFKIQSSTRIFKNFRLSGTGVERLN